MAGKQDGGRAMVGERRNGFIQSELRLSKAKLPRSARQVELTIRDWDGPRRVKIRKTQFSSPDGSKPIVTLLRAMARHHSKWWTTGQLRRCLLRVMNGHVYRQTFQDAVRRGQVERARNPDWDPSKLVSEGNPAWFYKITRAGLSLVAFME